MRQKMLIANWKLYKTLQDAIDFATTLKESLAEEVDCLNVDLAICPSYPLIPIVKNAISGVGVKVGSQNMSLYVEGAFTGEVGVKQLDSLGCSYVILGHSERRNVFGETNELIREKLVLVFTDSPMTPVLCVGESLEIRKSGKAVEFTLGQLDHALSGFAPELLNRLVIAYEPVWAIGTGVNATPADAQTMCKEIRDHLAAKYSWGVASQIRVLYGGSIKPGNWRELLTGPDVDGGLVGGASLNPTDFYTLYQITSGG
jgi:triosephosphate isomerase (TIM)